MSGQAAKNQSAISVTNAKAQAHVALAERYRSSSAESPGWNETLSVLLAHRSVRAFLPRKVEPWILEAAIAAAQSASSSLNLQLWSVIAVQDPKRKARLCLGVADQRWIREAPLYLIWAADLSRHARIAERASVGGDLLDPDNLDPLATSLVDVSLAAQNAAVAFESLGLGFCYIGAVRLYQRELRDELALPSHVVPIFGMCVGYPDPDRPTGVKPRLPQAAVLHRERYDATAEAGYIDRYDAHMYAFQGEQKIQQVIWSEYSLRRLFNLHASEGREAYNAALRDLNLAR